MSIALVGVDGAGKSTCATLLRERLTATISGSILGVRANRSGVASRYISQSAGVSSPDSTLAFACLRLGDLDAHSALLATMYDIVIWDRHSACIVASAIADGADPVQTARLWLAAPRPSVTVWLRIDADEAIRRIAERDGGCSPNSSAVCGAAERLASAYESLLLSAACDGGSSLLILDALLPPASLIDRIQAAVREIDERR